MLRVLLVRVDVSQCPRPISSAPVFLDQFNSTLSPLCEDAEEQEPEEDTPPKEASRLGEEHIASVTFLTWS